MNSINGLRTGFKTSLTILAGAISLITCVAPANAQAQAQSDAYTTPASGSYNPSWYLAPSLNLIDPDDKFGITRRGGGVGLRVGKPISQSWDIQIGSTLSIARDDASHYRQNTFGVDALYLFSRGRFRPFLLLGIGAQYDKANTASIQASHTSPYLNAGIGAQYSFNDQWGMQVDYRAMRSDLRGNDLPFDRAHTNLLAVGLTYTFDKPAAPARVAPAPVAIAQQPAAIAPTPPAPVAPPVAVAPPPPRFERTTLSATELFSFNSAELRTPMPKLDEIADALSRDPSISAVSINGYSDRLGSSKYNIKLSQQRADAVKGYLTQKGIDAGRLTANGKGETSPVIECKNKKRTDLIKCLEPNRRVEIEQIVIERRVN